jgi:hypothetical protein
MRHASDLRYPLFLDSSKPVRKPTLTTSFHTVMPFFSATRRDARFSGRMIETRRSTGKRRANPYSRQARAASVAKPVPRDRGARDIRSQLRLRRLHLEFVRPQSPMQVRHSPSRPLPRGRGRWRHSVEDCAQSTVRRLLNPMARDRSAWFRDRRERAPESPHRPGRTRAELA